MNLAGVRFSVLGLVSLGAAGANRRFQQSVGVALAIRAVALVAQRSSL